MWSTYGGSLSPVDAARLLAVSYRKMPSLLTLTPRATSRLTQPGSGCPPSLLRCNLCCQLISFMKPNNRRASLASKTLLCKWSTYGGSLSPVDAARFPAVLYRRMPSPLTLTHAEKKQYR
jgi:hypothetical protein